jgi:hypothetical protein
MMKRLITEQVGGGSPIIRPTLVTVPNKYPIFGCVASMKPLLPGPGGALVRRAGVLEFTAAHVLRSKSSDTPHLKVFLGEVESLQFYLESLACTASGAIIKGFIM